MKENKKYSLQEIDVREPITPFLYKLIPVNPEDVVDVNVVKEADTLLSKADQQKFLSPDYLLSHAKIALKSDKQSALAGSDYVFSYPEEGRSLPVAFGKVRYGDNFVGNHISTKGSGLSGFVPYLSQYRLKQDYVNTPTSHQTPYGLFGRESALEDIKYSLSLLNLGIKTALPLGFIVLKRDTIARYTKLYSDNKALQALSRQAFQVIDTYDDDPVLYFRLGGTRRRLHFVGDYHRSTQSFSFHKYTERLSLWQGIQLLSSELYSSRPSVSRTKSINDPTQAELQDLQTATKPDDQTQKVTLKIILTYQEKLTQTLESMKMSKDPLIQKFLSYLYLPNYGGNSILKDLDTSLCWYDFEGIEKRGVIYSQSPASIVAADLIGEYLGLLKKNYLIPNDLYTHSAI